MIHPSVLGQPLPDTLKGIYATNPKIVCELLDLEKEIWGTIKYVPGKYPSVPEANQSGKNLAAQAEEAVKKAVEAFHTRVM
jgi:hypothetical protein